MGGTVDIDPVLRGALKPGDAMTHFIVQDLGAATRDRGQACIAQPHDGVAQGEIAVLRNRQYFGC